MHIPQTEVILRSEGTELVRVTLPPGEYVIGRDAQADIRGDTAQLARRHALLTINYDHLLIEDLGSGSGTFVNGQPVTECTRLFPNQPVRLGDVTLEIHRQRAPAYPDASLAPAQAAVRRVLPDEILAEKRYAIGGIVAQGGMGAILDAQQAAMKRRVAMKVMLDSADPADVLRFVGEAQVTGQLEHPNIVPVHELGVDEQDQLFYTMKLVRGTTLKQVLALLAGGDGEAEKKYPLPVLLTVFQKICDALAFAHSRGVIHRDLKPENIMLGDFGEVLVMDWGLAKVLGKKTAPASARSAVFSARAAAGDASDTASGTILGTPAYMSPEQARGEIDRLDAASDIYALGAILFEMLHLRPAVTGPDARSIVTLVARGEVAWNVTQAFQPVRGGSRAGKPVSPSLLAVCRKALALDPAARFASVADLQADMLAYQNGFATSAENAGAWKQLTLLVKRNKAASIGTAAVLLVGSVFGTKAVIEGHRAEREAIRANAALADLKIEADRAEREAIRANAALADLKKTAPALRQLAESEAGFQRFDSALAKLDAAIDLDPADLSAYWRRAWLFIGMDRLADAAAAIRFAQQKDSAHGDLATILPTIEKLAALPPSEPWPAEDARKLYDHLGKVRASGETSALSERLRLSKQDKQKLVRQRLDEWLGKGKGGCDITPKGLVQVYLDKTSIDTIEPLQGLPIERLTIGETKVAKIESVKEMPLVELYINTTQVNDLTPLRGMLLRTLSISNLSVEKITELTEMPLQFFDCAGCGQLTDLSPLSRSPLRKLIARYCPKISDIRFLADSPIEELALDQTKVSELSPLRDKPLRSLSVRRCRIANLSPLRGAPIEILEIDHNAPLTDLTPLLDLPKLKKLRVSKLGKILEPLRRHPSLEFIAYDDDAYRSVAEFWTEYDAKVAAEKNAPKK